MEISHYAAANNLGGFITLLAINLNGGNQCLSTKKHKDRYDNGNGNNLDMNNIQNMLNNIDMNQLSNIMSSLNKGNNNYNNHNNYDDDYDDDETYDSNNSFNNMNNNVNNNMNKNLFNNMNPNQMQNDYTLQFLNMLRPMVNPDKKDLLDKLIQIYYVSRLMKK
ncbi:hypothetical protein CFSAN002367_12114 [Clostridium botulinum CFSAN002367]|nr:hypothetical protein CFSAN002367_12114 [Clostridium botulinum CFSAN002367]